MSRRFAFIVLAVLLASCSTPQASPSTPPSANVSPLPVPTETLEYSDEEYSQQLTTLYEMLSYEYGETKVLEEAANRLLAGQIEDSKASEILTNMSAVSQDMQPFFESTVLADSLAGGWDFASASQNKLQEIVSAWLAQDLTPEQAIASVHPLQEEIGSRLDALDAIIVKYYDVNPDDLDIHRVATVNMMLENNFGRISEACGGAEPVQASAGPARQLAFVSTREGTSEIYLINDDGTGLTLVTSGKLGAFHPSWSPDGTRIAFFSYRDGNAEIYMINIDGSGLTRLTNHSADDFDPAWSPDGTQIAFHTHRFQQNPEIAVMNADGTGVRRITTTPAIGGWSPSWSPDGAQLVFNSSYGPSLDIWTMNADGSDLVKRTYHTAEEWWPAWSPDGKLLAYHSDRDGNQEIYLFNLEDLTETRLTNNASADYNPAWSSDASRIAFSSNDRNVPEICIMNADGTGMVNLTNNPGMDSSAAWRP